MYTYQVQSLFLDHLSTVTKTGIHRSLVAGFGFAFGHFTMFLAYFVAFSVACKFPQYMHIRA